MEQHVFKKSRNGLIFLPSEVFKSVSQSAVAFLNVTV